jgi:hypothetical protein
LAGAEANRRDFQPRPAEPPIFHQLLPPTPVRV